MIGAFLLSFLTRSGTRLQTASGYPTMELNPIGESVAENEPIVRKPFDQIPGLKARNQSVWRVGRPARIGYSGLAMKNESSLDCRFADLFCCEVCSQRDVCHEYLASRRLSPQRLEKSIDQILHLVISYDHLHL